METAPLDVGEGRTVEVTVRVAANVLIVDPARARLALGEIVYREAFQSLDVDTPTTRATVALDDLDTADWTGAAR